MVNALSAPIDVSIELTDKCNLVCVHCFQPEYRQGKLLSTREIFSLSDELSNLKVFSIFLSGGEPFLREDWDVIGRYLIDKGFVVGISSNGTLITKNIAKKLYESQLYKGLQISIDGSCPKIHDSIRGIGSFEKTMQAIKHLDEYDIHPNIAVTVMNDNINDIPKIIELAVTNRMRHVHIIALMPGGRAKAAYKKLDPPLDKWLDMEEKVLKITKKVKNKLTIDWANRRYLPPNKDFTVDNYNDVDKTFTGCPAGKTKAEIDCYGNVYGCDILKSTEFLAGNIRSNNFKYIWDNSKVFNQWRSRTPDKIRGKCERCKWLFACVGGCPALSMKDNDIFGSDDTCPNM